MNAKGNAVARIEIKAVTAVENCIADTKILIPKINIGDTEPSWDGEIQIYKDESNSKDGMIRIPVQVKGVSSSNVRRKSDNTILFSVETKDLRNYYKDGGVIFFVVEIPESGDPIIYYKQLLPGDINDYLNNKESQETISVEFRLFPVSDPEKIKEIILKASQERQKQFSSINCTKEDLERYKSGGYQLKFAITHSPNASVLQEINDQQPYLYAIIDDSIPIVVGKIANISGMQTEREGNISVEDEIFYKNYKLIEDKSRKITLIFGQSFRLIFSPPESESLVGTKQISFKISGTLNERISDLDFYCKAIQNKGFEIEGQKINLQLVDGTNSFKEAEDSLDFLRQFREALNNAGYREDLSFDGFDDKTRQLAGYFVSIFVDKKEINFEELIEGSYYYSIRFGKEILPIYIEKHDGHCFIKNPYEICPYVYVNKISGEKIIIPRYLFTPEKMLSSLTYLDLDTILYKLQNNEMSDFYHEIVTEFLLNVLRACDNDAPLKDKYLAFSMDLANWLYNKSEDLDEKIRIISLINLLQIKKRLYQQLDQDDIKKILPFLINSSQLTEEIKTGLYILVNDFSNAINSFSKMTIDEQKVFLKFPIMHFWDTEKYPLPQASSQEDEHADEAKAKEGTD